MSYPERRDMETPSEQPPVDNLLTDKEHYAKVRGNYADLIRAIQEGTLDPEQVIDQLTSHEVYLESLATIDPLTGLLNRRGFFIEFGKTLERFKRKLANANPSSLVVPGSILVIDFDNFKQTNNRKGHPFGDQVLVTVTRALENTLRAEDTISRFGGEEFAIVLSEAKLNAAIGVAERIRKVASQSTRESELLKGFEQTVSIGVAEMEPVSANLLDSEEFQHRLFDKVFKKSDDALLFAKSSGKNCIAFTDKNSEIGVLEGSSAEIGRVVRYQNPAYHPGK